MNCPSTLGCNWKWRLKDGDITQELLIKIQKLTRRSFRMNRETEEETDGEKDKNSKKDNV